MSPQSEDRSIRVWSRVALTARPAVVFGLVWSRVIVLNAEPICETSSMPAVPDRKSLFRSKWIWIPLMLSAASVSTANTAVRLIQFPVLDRSPLPGTLQHLGDAGQVHLTDDDDGLLDAGNSQWKKRHADAAIQEWSKVFKTYGQSERSIPALLNIGRVASAQIDRRGAITAFTTLIDVPESLLKKPPKARWGFDRVAFAKHRACVELSDLFLELGELESSLKFTALAHDVHKPVDWCGMAYFSEQSWLKERIDAIELALAGGRPVAIEPRSTTLARVYSERRRPPL